MENTIEYHGEMKLDDYGIVRAKIRIPQLPPTTILRERLFARLDQGMKKGLTVVTGAAGSGKSALAISWLETRRMTGAWYTIDDYDNDVLTFFRYLLQTLVDVYGEMLDGFALYLQSLKEAESPLRGEEISAAFLGEMERVDRQIVIILDDFHHITDLSVLEAVRFLVAHLPGHGALFILSRSQPAFPLARFRIGGRLEEIQSADLAFSESEVLACCGGRAASGSVQEIVEATGGWVIAVRLVALAMQSGEGLDPARLAGSSQDFSGYLLEEVLGSLDDRLQYLLLRCAVPDTISFSLFRYLDEKLFHGKINGYDFLRELETRELFVTVADPDLGVYRFHDFFRNFLIHMLERRNPGNRREVESHVSDWFLLQHNIGESLEYAFRSGDGDRIAPLLELYAREHSDDRRLFRHRRWLEEFQRYTVTPVPEIEMHQARLHLYRGQIAEALAHLSRADSQVCPDMADYAGIKSRILIMQAVVAMFGGDHSTVTRLCRSALTLIDGRFNRYYSMALTYLGLSGLYSGEMDLNQTVGTLERAETAGIQCGDLILAFGAAFQRTLFMIAGGEYAASYIRFKEIISEIEERKLPLFGILGNCYGEMASLVCKLGYEDDALGMADKGLELAEESCSVTSIWWSRYARVRVLVSLDAEDEIEESFRSLFQFEKEHRILPWQLDDSCSSYLLYRLDRGEPVELPARFLDIPEDLTYLKIPQTLVFARYLLAGGRTGEAEKLLGKIITFSQSVGNRWCQGIARQMLSQITMNSSPAVSPSREYMHEELLQTETAYREKLSGREVDVARLLSRGYTNLQIAENLFISLNTVKTHLKNINGKLGTTNRTQAVHVVRELGYAD